MRNRIRNIVKDYIEMYKENYTDLATLEKKYQTYKDLLYQNWKNDLISHNVIDDCYEELCVIIFYYHRKN